MWFFSQAGIGKSHNPYFGLLPNLLFLQCTTHCTRVDETMVKFDFAMMIIACLLICRQANNRQATYCFYFANSLLQPTKKIKYQSQNNSQEIYSEYCKIHSQGIVVF